MSDCVSSKKTNCKWHLSPDPDSPASQVSAQKKRNPTSADYARSYFVPNHSQKAFKSDYAAPRGVWQSPIAEKIQKNTTVNHYAELAAMLNILASPPGPEVAGRVRQLRADLNSVDTSAQLQAIKALSKILRSAQAAVPDLLALAKNNKGSGRIAPLAEVVDPVELRVEAARAVILIKGGTGKEVKTVVPVLISALEKAAPAVRVRAINALLHVIDPVVRTAIPALSVALKAKDPRVRLEAAMLLAYIALPTGEEARAAVPILVKALTDPKALKSKGSDLCWALENIGPAAWPAIPALVKGLEHQDPFFRKSCLKALNRIGPYSPEAVPAVTALLTDPDTQISMAAARLLAKYGARAKGSVPALLRALTIKRTDFHSDYWERALAEAMGQIAVKAPDVIPKLIAALSHEEERVRAGALKALVKVGPLAQPALSAVMEILKGPFSWELYDAVMLVEAIGPGAKQATPLLVKRLEERHPRPSTSMIPRALAAIGPEAKSAVPALSKLLFELKGRPGSSLRQFDRVDVATALALIAGPNSPEGKGALAALVHMVLHHESKFIRTHSAEALGKISRTNPGVVSALVAALQDQDGEVRWQALLAIKALGPKAKEAVPALSSYLNSAKVGVLVKMEILTILRAMGGQSLEALPSVLAAMKSSNPHIKGAATATLQAITLSAKDNPDAAVRALAAALRDVNLYEPDPSMMRQQIISALSRIPADISAAKTDLIKALEDENAGVRFLATQLLGKIGKGDDVLEILIISLKDENAPVVLETVRALGKFGPAAKQALPALKRLKRDSFDKKIVKAVRIAIRQIRSEVP